MEYNKIPVILKRYSFQEKMRLCNYQSKQIMDFVGIRPIEQLTKNPMPWELETFALFSIMSEKEYDNQKFDNMKSNRQFVNIINCLKNYSPTAINTSFPNERFLENLLIGLGSVQFHLQESHIYKLVRHSYFFNFVNENTNIKDEFQLKFKTNYNDFIIFSWFISFFNNRPHPNEYDIFIFLFKKFHIVFSHLQISRNDFINLQKQVTTNIEHYHYCFKYFYQFPFIEEKGTHYLPLPHVFNTSVTTSLLYRLTEGNKTLRDKFGKEVLESYITYITNNSFVYEEIVPEFVITTSKGDIRTYDLMIKNNEYCLLIDIKSIVPRRNIRHLDEPTIEYTRELIAKQIISFYNHFNNHFNKTYSPFRNTINFCRENIFGLIITLENTYLLKESVIELVASKLSLPIDSQEIKWITSNIKIASLYEYESIIYNNINIFHELIVQRDSPEKWFDIGLITSETDFNHTENKIIQEFFSKLQPQIESFGQELLKEGLI